MVSFFLSLGFFFLSHVSFAEKISIFQQLNPDNPAFLAIPKYRKQEGQEEYVSPYFRLKHITLFPLFYSATLVTWEWKELY